MDESKSIEERVNQLSPYRSEGERRIAQTLQNYGIPFLYEPVLELTHRGKRHRYRPDFYLPTHDCYIEYLGRVTNPGYDLRTQTKLDAYAANRIPHLPVYPWHLIQDWPNHLFDYLRSRPPNPYPSKPMTRSRYPLRRYPQPGRTARHTYAQTSKPPYRR